MDCAILSSEVFTDTGLDDEAVLDCSILLDNKLSGLDWLETNPVPALLHADIRVNNTMIIIETDFCNIVAVFFIFTVLLFEFYKCYFLQ